VKHWLGRDSVPRRSRKDSKEALEGCAHSGAM